MHAATYTLGGQPLEVNVSDLLQAITLGRRSHDGERDLGITDAIGNAQPQLPAPPLARCGTKLQVVLRAPSRLERADLDRLTTLGASTRQRVRDTVDRGDAAPEGDGLGATSAIEDERRALGNAHDLRNHRRMASVSTHRSYDGSRRGRGGRTLYSAS